MSQFRKSVSDKAYDSVRPAIPAAAGSTEPDAPASWYVTIASSADNATMMLPRHSRRTPSQRLATADTNDARTFQSKRAHVSSPKREAAPNARIVAQPLSASEKAA